MAQSVLIVGCGVFGASTALVLTKKGYKVTAIDAYKTPSPWAASCDYNKIIRAEYTDMIYTKMAIEAINLWRSDPILKDTFNECGRVMITPELHKGRIEFERKGFENLAKLGFGKNIVTFTGGDDLAVKVKSMKYNSIMSNEITHFNPESGLAHAAHAVTAVYREAERLGAKFVFGLAGKAVKIERVGSKALVKCADGSSYTADKVLICCGANTARVLDMKNQQAATGLFVTFIKLTPEEYEEYKDMPVIFDASLGYFFPPDPETHLLKIALPGSGATNLVSNPHSKTDKLSLPRYHNQYPTDTMPTWGIRRAKEVLGKYVPELAYHKLINSKVCWIADTSDSNFIIDAVPGYNNLYVASGDSGHGFKFLPNIGKYITEIMEGTASSQMKQAWRWREDAPQFDPTKCDWRISDNFPDLSDVDWIPAELKSKI